MNLELNVKQLAEDGYTIVANVLSRERAEEILKILWVAEEESRRRGAPTRYAGILDPNEHNVRIGNLPDLAPAFLELVEHPIALEFVRRVVGEYFLLSNFTANIALPGSGSMAIHSDQALVLPEPWLQPWAVNIIWCLTDAREENGATLFLPGSHKVTRESDLPPDMASCMRPFEAEAGSFIVMDGRMWHTSGANRTSAEERALLFAYYSSDFIRPQMNWNAALSQTTLDALSQRLRVWFGLEPYANIRIGVEKTNIWGKPLTQ